MTKLEELKAGYDTARDAYAAIRDAYDAAYVAYAAARDVRDAAYDAYKAELKKESTND